MEGPGGWTGFPTLAGRSDVWVQAFVVAHVGRLGFPRSVMHKARSQLRTAQKRDGGWSYGSNVPSDADSTAWALAALSRLPADAHEAARSFLRAHHRDMGFATFSRESGIAQYIGANDRSVDGWTSSHPDVTAAVLASDSTVLNSTQLEAALGQLQAQQTGAGFVSAYWWRGPFYASALMLRAFWRSRRRIAPETADRLVVGLEREQMPHGGFGLGASLDLDAFNTALALECLCRLPGSALTERRVGAVEALLRSQRPDGTWAGDFVLRIPSPDVIDPTLVRAWQRGSGGGNSYVFDTNGVFATALAAYSIHLWDESRTQTLSVRDWPEIPRRTPTSYDGEEMVTVSGVR
jgi:hypothetical protein